MKQSMLLFSFVALALALALTSCTKKAAVPVAGMNPEQLAERGRAIYVGNCIACHNTDPQKDGTIGPAVAGSGYELLHARLMKAEYPHNYKPKRDTRTMVAMPHLKDEISALATYLSSITGGTKNP